MPSVLLLEIPVPTIGGFTSGVRMESRWGLRSIGNDIE